MDWNDDPGLPTLTIHSPDGVNKLAVDGHMSAEKQAFNKRRFAGPKKSG